MNAAATAKCTEINDGTVRMHDMHDYETGERIGAATDEQLAASIAAARTDGGAGVILVDGRAVYVMEG